MPTAPSNPPEPLGCAPTPALRDFISGGGWWPLSSAFTGPVVVRTLRKATGTVGPLKGGLQAPALEKEVTPRHLGGVLGHLFGVEEGMFGINCSGWSPFAVALWRLFKAGGQTDPGL